MTTSSNALWLLVVVGMLALVAARLSRSLGPVGLILTIVLVIVLLKLARDLLQARFRSPSPDQQRTTKNVTPQEGWLRPGDTIFVPAETVHRFHDIDEELRLIVVFAPPEGSQSGG